MKKVTSVIIVICFILGGLEAAATQSINNNGDIRVEKTVALSIDDLTITEKDDQYIRVSLSENDQFLLNPGKPILPKMVL